MAMFRKARYSVDSSTISSVDSSASSSDSSSSSNDNMKRNSFETNRTSVMSTMTVKGPATTARLSKVPSSTSDSSVDSMSTRRASYFSSNSGSSSARSPSGLRSSSSTVSAKSTNTQKSKKKRLFSKSSFNGPAPKTAPKAAPNSPSFFRGTKFSKATYALLPADIHVQIFGYLYHERGRKTLRTMRLVSKRFNHLIINHFMRVHIEMEFGWELLEQLRSADKKDLLSRAHWDLKDRSSEMLQTGNAVSPLNETWRLRTMREATEFHKFVTSGRMDTVLENVQSITIYLPGREVTMHDMDYKKKPRVPLIHTNDPFLQVDWSISWVLNRFLPRHPQIRSIELIRPVQTLNTVPAAIKFIENMPHVEKRIVLGDRRPVLEGTKPMSELPSIKKLSVGLENLNLYVDLPLDVETLELSYVASKTRVERVNSQRLSHFLGRFKRLHTLKMRGVFVETVVPTSWLPSTVKTLDVDCTSPLNHPEPVEFPHVLNLSVHGAPGCEDPFSYVDTPNAKTVKVSGVTQLNSIPPAAIDVSVTSNGITTLKPVLRVMPAAVERLEIGTIKTSNPHGIKYLQHLTHLQELVLGFAPQCNDIPINWFGKYSKELHSVYVHWGSVPTFYKLLSNDGWIEPVHLTANNCQLAMSEPTITEIPALINAYRIDVPLMRASLKK